MSEYQSRDLRESQSNENTVDVIKNAIIEVINKYPSAIEDIALDKRDETASVRKDAAIGMIAEYVANFLLANKLAAGKMHSIKREIKKNIGNEIMEWLQLRARKDLSDGCMVEISDEEIEQFAIKLGNNLSLKVYNDANVARQILHLAVSESNIKINGKQVEIKNLDQLIYSLIGFELKGDKLEQVRQMMVDFVTDIRLDKLAKLQQGVSDKSVSLEDYWDTTEAQESANQLRVKIMDKVNE
jgi:hypothetical protein